MKPNGRDYTTDPVLKRLAYSDHVTLILALRLLARGPHTEGFQILDVHDDESDDGGNQGHISDVSASQADPDDTETVPAVRTDSVPPPPTEEQQVSRRNVEDVVVIEPQSQEEVEVTQTTTTEGQQQEGITEAATEEALPRSRDDDAPPEQFKCTVPGCDRTFSEPHELKGTSSYPGTRYLHADPIPQPTLTSTTTNRIHAQLKGVTRHIPRNARGTGIYPSIVSRYNSDCRALVLPVRKKRQKRQQRIQPLSLKLKQHRRCHPCSFLPRYLPMPTHQMRQRLEIRPRHNPGVHYVIFSCSFVLCVCNIKCYIHSQINHGNALLCAMVTRFDGAS